MGDEMLHVGAQPAEKHSSSTMSGHMYNGGFHYDRIKP